MQNARKAYPDILRILAIFLVLFNHLPGYYLFQHTHGMTQACNLMIATLTRINVPMFAMISGALLLGREESYSNLWRKRIRRMLIVIPLFTTMLYLEIGLLKGHSISIAELIRGIFSGDLRYLDSYWFLYAYLGFLLMLPFLRKIARAMTKGDFWMLMTLHVIFLTIVPLINFGLQMSGLEKLVLSHNLCIELSTATLLFYPLIGYYIDHEIEIEDVSRRRFLWLIFASFVGMMLTALITYLYGEHAGYVQDYLNIFNYLPVITLFLLVKKATSIHSGPKVAWLGGLSSLVFGIYLLDNYLKVPLYNDFQSLLLPVCGTLGMSLLWCIFSFIVCGAITWMLKKLPLFKQIC